jgi:hypothetical protein
MKVALTLALKFKLSVSLKYERLKLILIQARGMAYTGQCFYRRKASYARRFSTLRLLPTGLARSRAAHVLQRAG